MMKIKNIKFVQFIKSYTDFFFPKIICIIDIIIYFFTDVYLYLHTLVRSKLKTAPHTQINQLVVLGNP